jgi:hypothetical protein
MNWREVGHSEAMRFAVDKPGAWRAEHQPLDAPQAWTLTYYFEDGTALRVTHTSMDSHAPVRYDIGEP